MIPPNAVVNSWWTQFAFYLLNAECSPVDTTVSLKLLPSGNFVDWLMLQQQEMKGRGWNGSTKGWDLLNANVVLSGSLWSRSLKVTILKNSTHLTMLHFGLFIKMPLSHVAVNIHTFKSLLCYLFGNSVKFFLFQFSEFEPKFKFQTKSSFYHLDIDNPIGP